MKKIRLLACLSVLLSASVFADRVEMRLDGAAWTLDGLPVLVPDSWNKIDASDGQPGEKTTPTTFVPSVQAGSYVRRAGVYSRRLPDAKSGRRYFIRCEGASQTAAVLVNGVLLGTHKGAFTAFCYEATAAMKPTGNVLEIQVSNAFDPAIPPVSGDFTMCGGLYRSVWLVETDPVCIDPTRHGGPGVRVFPSMDGSVRVEADVSGADDAVVDWEPKKIENPRLWSPETPHVYEVTVTVRKGTSVDTVVQPFGFRTAEIREDGFYLNGRKRKVRGVNRHQDLEGAGWALSAAQEERDIRLIKTMGADGLRLAHYPQSENIYGLCDRLGLMVWSEIPVVDEMGSDEFMANAREMLREMIAQHRNHPSVCWWGVWNEVRAWEPVDQSKSLVSLVASLDPTRPVVAASCMPRNKAMNASVPNLCFNMYPRWYTPWSLSQCVDDIYRRNPFLKTIALPEYGAGGSVYHQRNPAGASVEPISPFHPEEWQTHVHCEDYRLIKDDARLWGSFVWAMFDFAADGRREGDRHGVNDKGLVTRDRVVPKDAYWFYKANWNPEPMLHLCGKRLTATTSGRVDVTAFSNEDREVTLFVNGRRIASRKPDDVNTVVFKDVPLTLGENGISVVSGDRTDSCAWRLDAPAAE